MSENNSHKIADFNLVLANRIIRYYPRGFISGIIEGERGFGKSMYALKVMAQVYKTLDTGLDDTGAWDKALDNMLFSMEDTIKFIDKNIRENIVIPVWCLDDATVHFCSYKYFTHIHEVILVHGLFDTIRTICTGLLLTCPNRNLLLAALRNYDDFKIEIYKDREWQRIARGYKIKTSPIGQKRVYKNYEDKYSCYVPNWIFEKYTIKRTHYLKEVNDEMQKMLKVRMQNKKLNEISGTLRRNKLEKQYGELGEDITINNGLMI